VHEILVHRFLACVMYLVAVKGEVVSCSVNLCTRSLAQCVPMCLCW